MALPDENPNAVTHIRNNKIALRACISYEYLIGKSSFEAYKSFCKQMGDDIMEYGEFDFWFYTLGKEGVALDSEISWNPKSKLLGDMPNEILVKIMDIQDPINRIVIRKVSQRFRSLFDVMDPGFKSFKCVLDTSEVEVVLKDNYTPRDDSYSEADDYNSEYEDDYDDYERLLKDTIIYDEDIREKSHVNVRCGNRVKQMKDELYYERAAKDLLVILKNPKLRLEQFIFKFGSSLAYSDLNQAENFASILKSCSPIHAKQVRVEYPDLAFDASKILSLFQPKALTNIKLKCSNLADISAIFELEQWKNAKSVEINSFTKFPIGNLFHLSQFSVKLESFSVDDAIKIRDILLKSPSFQSGKFTSYSSNFQEMLKVFVPRFDGLSGSLVYTNKKFKFIIEAHRGFIKFEKVGAAV
ncbi:F-box domain-containing protein [Caenorhabditis elegans]|nr:F-box domain-containing protein [Caenorhabditis elegans]CAB60570.1 F-box domain-containing protein [Caenorhabditis elegans]|eukprot:NP_001256784.1 F-box A protein [Caenorhabditis elegans]